MSSFIRILQVVWVQQLVEVAKGDIMQMSDFLKLSGWLLDLKRG